VKVSYEYITKLNLPLLNCYLTNQINTDKCPVAVQKVRHVQSEPLYVLPYSSVIYM